MCLTMAPNHFAAENLANEQPLKQTPLLTTILKEVEIELRKKLEGRYRRLYEGP